MRRVLSLCLLLMAVYSQIAMAANAPQAVRALMPKGAISLRWQELKTNTTNGPVWLHLYCLPRGHSDQLAYLDIKRTGPVKREHITNGPSLKLSPFWLDVFHPDRSAWRRLNSVKFDQDQDVNKVVLRWLVPKQRTGPVLLLDFGYSHWHEWEVFTFPRGWKASAYHQTFLWGSDGDYCFQRFDKTDAAGRLFIEEEIGHEGKISFYRYRWNGYEWEDLTQKYFVIGATTRSKATALAEYRRRGFGEVLFSSHYPRLRPGYYIWVAGRYRSMAEANEQLKGLKTGKIKTYIRRVR